MTLPYNGIEGDERMYNPMPESMNKALFSEKAGQIDNEVLIFRADQDCSKPWVINRILDYQKKGYKVIVRNARTRDRNNRDDRD